MKANPVSAGCRSSVRLLPALVLTFAVGVSVSPASAADPSTERAKALYEVGLTDYNLGHFDDALKSFELAYRLRHDSVFLFNIGQCQRQLRRYQDAERSYRAYLRESTDLPQSTREKVQRLIAEMQKAIDDAQAKLPTGSHPVQEAQPSQPILLPPPRGTAPAALVAVNPADERNGRIMLIAGAAAAAVGVAAIAAGAGFFSVAKSANDSVNNPADRVFSASAEDRRNTYQALDIAAFVIGGIVVASGTTVAVLGLRKRHRFSVAPASGAGPTVNVIF